MNAMQGDAAGRPDVLIRRLDPGVPLPGYAHPGDAGADLVAAADVELAPMRALLEPAAELAISMDHPAYDCTYLALAESLSCDLVTADVKLSAKPLPLGYKSKVLGLTTSALP